jgi:hypothetical protein
MALKRLTGVTIWLFTGVLCAGAANAQAISAESGLRLNGFGTLGLTKDSSDFGGSFRRDIAQPLKQQGLRGSMDSRLGVQANYAVNDQLELVAQVIARQRSSRHQLEGALDWAFAAYELTPQTQVRIGRTGMDLFLQSDYRNVGFAYLAARPPVDFYGLLPLAGLDGIDLTQRWTEDNAEWRLKGFAGKSSYSVETGGVSVQKGDLDWAGGLVLSRESHGLLLRGTLSKAKLVFRSIDISNLRQGLGAVASLPIPTVAAQAAAFNDQILFDNIRVTYGSLGVAYDRDNWIFTSEVLGTQSNAPLTAFKAGYVMIGRRLGNVTLHTSVSGNRSNIKAAVDPQWGQVLEPLRPVIGSAAIAQAQAVGTTAAALINSGRVEQRTVSMGLRWDIDPRVALKLQWDHVVVSPNGGAIWQGNPNGGRANVGTVLLDFLF